MAIGAQCTGRPVGAPPPPARRQTLAPWPAQGPRRSSPQQNLIIMRQIITWQVITQLREPTNPGPWGGAARSRRQGLGPHPPPIAGRGLPQVTRPPRPTLLGQIPSLSDSGGHAGGNFLRARRGLRRRMRAATRAGAGRGPTQCPWAARVTVAGRPRHALGRRGTCAWTHCQPRGRSGGSQCAADSGGLTNAKAHKRVGASGKRKKERVS